MNKLFVLLLFLLLSIKTYSTTISDLREDRRLIEATLAQRPTNEPDDINNYVNNLMQACLLSCQNSFEYHNYIPKLADLLRQYEVLIDQAIAGEPQAELGLAIIIGNFSISAALENKSFDDLTIDYLNKKFTLLKSKLTYNNIEEECTLKFLEANINNFNGKLKAARDGYKSIYKILKNNINIDPIYLQSYVIGIMCLASKDNKIIDFKEELHNILKDHNLENNLQKLKFISYLLVASIDQMGRISDETYIYLLKKFVEFGGKYDESEEASGLLAFSISAATNGRENILEFIETQLIKMAVPKFDNVKNGLKYSIAEQCLSLNNGGSVFGFYEYCGTALCTEGKCIQKGIEFQHKAIQLAIDNNRRDMLYEIASDSSIRTPILAFLADAYRSVGDYENELIIYEKLVDFIGKDLGFDTPEAIIYSIQLTNRINEYQNNLAKSIEILKGILTHLQENSDALTHYSEFYMQLAFCCNHFGNSDEAIEYAQLAKKYIPFSTSESPTLTSIEIFLAAKDNDNGDIDKSIRAVSQIDTDQLHNLDDTWDLANLYHSQGKNEEAIELLETKIKIFKEKLTDSDLFHYYELLSSCYLSLYKYEEARKYYDKCDAYIESQGMMAKLQYRLKMSYISLNEYERYKILTAVRNDYTNSGLFDLDLEINIYRGLGWHYLQVLDYNNAIDNFQRALALNKETGKNSFYRKANLMNLNECYLAKKDYKNAYECTKLLCSIYENVEEKYIQERTTFLGDHIENCIKYGKMDEALSLLKEYQQLTPFSNSRLLRAQYAIKNKEYELAESILLDLRESDNPWVKEKVSEIMENLYSELKSPNLEIYLEENLNIFKSDIINRLLFMSPSERFKLSSTCRGRLNELVEYASISQGCAKIGMEFSLFSKGLLFHSSNEIQKILKRNKRASEKFNLLNSLKIKQNKAFENSDTVTLETLRKEINEIERELSNEFVSKKKLEKSLFFTISDIQRNIGKNGLAVDFIRYQDRDTIKYGAFIYAASMKEPQFIPLFNERDLNDIAFTNNSEVKSSFYKNLNKHNGFSLIWGKLLPFFENYNDIYFSADGALHTLAIEFLPDENNIPLSQTYRVHRVFHLAEISKLKKLGNEFIAIGVSDYDPFVKGLTSEDRGNWGPLEGVLKEFQKIDEILNKVKPRISNSFYLNENAKETFVKALSGNKVSTLHFASHGFYINQKALYDAAENEKDFNHNVAKRALMADKSYLSGLILCNGNVSWNSPLINDDEDDVLTSDEIEMLNFPDLRLTVLSACETGLGETDEDGVWGLQRSFRIAGSQSLISTLYRVDDDIAVEFMNFFYTKVTEGNSIFDAFQYAQKEIYESNILHPAPQKRWACFILIE